MASVIDKFSWFNNLTIALWLLKASPVEFNPPGRSYDLEAILRVIQSAEKYIYISVMDYSPEVINYKINSRSE